MESNFTEEPSLKKNIIVVWFTLNTASAQEMGNMRGQRRCKKWSVESGCITAAELLKIHPGTFSRGTGGKKRLPQK